jgi:hypothetical protein
MPLSGQAKLGVVDKSEFFIRIRRKRSLNVLANGVPLPDEAKGKLRSNLRSVARLFWLSPARAP